MKARMSVGIMGANNFKAEKKLFVDAGVWTRNLGEVRRRGKKDGHHAPCKATNNLWYEIEEDIPANAALSPGTNGAPERVHPSEYLFSD